jgi:hypothetical protein
MVSILAKDESIIFTSVGFEHSAVALHVVVGDLDVRLGEEAEDLGQQVAFAGV